MRREGYRNNIHKATYFTVLILVLTMLFGMIPAAAATEKNDKKSGTAAGNEKSAQNVDGYWISTLDKCYFVYLEKDGKGNMQSAVPIGRRLQEYDSEKRNELISVIKQYFSGERMVE